MTCFNYNDRKIFEIRILRALKLAGCLLPWSWRCLFCLTSVGCQICYILVQESGSRHPRVMEIFFGFDWVEIQASSVKAFDYCKDKEHRVRIDSD